MAPEIVQDAAFLDSWRARPVLVLSGEADERIPISYVNRQVSLLQAGGVQVTAVTFPGEDHFLLFSQPDELRQYVADWLPTGR